MTKQKEIREEIREGIAKILRVGYDPGVPYRDAPQEILHYLHSQGVVIKVKDIQPINTFEDLTQSVSEEGKYDVAVVEPLIGE